MATPSTKLAVLIDADNAQPGVVEGLLAEVAKYGTATVKRIYGDWTGPQLKGWKDVLLSYAIQPIQQFRYTTGKNATDSALIIDAMDLLWMGNVDAFALVSSDSDELLVEYSAVAHDGRVTSVTSPPSDPDFQGVDPLDVASGSRPLRRPACLPTPPPVPAR